MFGVCVCVCVCMHARVCVYDMYVYDVYIFFSILNIKSRAFRKHVGDIGYKKISKMETE